MKASFTRAGDGISIEIRLEPQDGHELTFSGWGCDQSQTIPEGLTSCLGQVSSRIRRPKVDSYSESVQRLAREFEKHCGSPPPKPDPDRPASPPLARRYPEVVRDPAEGPGRVVDTLTDRQAAESWRLGVESLIEKTVVLGKAAQAVVDAEVNAGGNHGISAEAMEDLGDALRGYLDAASAHSCSSHILRVITPAGAR